MTEFHSIFPIIFYCFLGATILLSLFPIMQKAWDWKTDLEWMWVIVFITGIVTLVMSLTGFDHVCYSKTVLLDKDQVEVFHTPYNSVVVHNKKDPDFFYEVGELIALKDSSNLFFYRVVEENLYGTKIKEYTIFSSENITEKQEN